MKYYTEQDIRYTIRKKFRDSEDTGEAENKMVELINTISETCYAMGKLEVQMAIIQALDINHLLGVR